MTSYHIGVDYGSPDGDHTVLTFYCTIGACKRKKTKHIYWSLSDLLTHVKTHFHGGPDYKILNNLIRQAKEQQL